MGLFNIKIIDNRPSGYHGSTSQQMLQWHDEDLLEKKVENKHREVANTHAKRANDIMEKRETKFKRGDRVVYIGASQASCEDMQNGDVYVVVDEYGRVDEYDGGFQVECAWTKNPSRKHFFNEQTKIALLQETR